MTQPQQDEALIEHIEAYLSVSDESIAIIQCGEIRRLIARIRDDAARIARLEGDVEALRADHETYCKSWDMRQRLIAAEAMCEAMRVALLEAAARGYALARGWGDDVNGDPTDDWRAFTVEVAGIPRKALAGERHE